MISVPGLYEAVGSDITAAAATVAAPATQSPNPAVGPAARLGGQSGDGNYDSVEIP